MSRALIIKGANFEANRVAQVTFSGIPCTAVALDSDAYTVNSMSVGTEITVTKTPLDTTDDLTLTVTNPSVARVENGMLYAVGFGSTTVTATCGNATATATVTVSAIQITPLKVSGRVQTVSSWGEENPIKYASNASYDCFVTEKTSPATTPDAILANTDIAVIRIPAGTGRMRIESPTSANWSIYIRYVTTDSTLNSGGLYFAKFVSSSTKAVAKTTDKYVEFTDIPSAANAFAFERAIDQTDTDYVMNVTFSAA